MKQSLQVLRVSHIVQNMDGSKIVDGFPTGVSRLISRGQLGAVGLLAANLGFLYLYFAYELSLYQLVIVYWWECLIDCREIAYVA